MIDYFITTAFNLIGIIYMVMVSIKKLRVKYPELQPRTIWGTFMKEEWDSMILSFVGLVAFELVLFTVRYNETVLPKWVEDFGLYALAAVWGYASQRLAYSVLNTSVAILQKKVDRLKEDNG